jgi:hypothetical protein
MACETGDLLNCPFCKGRPIAPSNIKKNKSITGCSNNKCCIFGVQITVKEWNKRTGGVLMEDKIEIMDDKVEIEVEIDEDAIAFLEEEARKRDITFDELVEDLLVVYIKGVNDEED